jgi:hypothetical protein
MFTNSIVFVSGLDGCFIKLTTGQQILAATGRDGNNNIFPLAFGIVDREETASWSWFLTQLKYAIGGQSGNFGYYTIISDRQKVNCIVHKHMSLNMSLISNLCLLICYNHVHKHVSLNM